MKADDEEGEEQRVVHSRRGEKRGEERKRVILVRGD
jgi:hypothetical protein